MKTPKRNYIAGFVFIFALILAFTACDSPADDPGSPPETYTVTFGLNGGSGTVPSPITGKYGYSITLPGGNGLSKSGYTFGGWNTEASGTGTNYSAGSSYTVYGSRTLYAKWNTTTATTTYTVTFDLNGGSGPAPTAQTVNNGSSITLPIGDGLTRDGFDFDGWNTNADGSGTNYSTGSSYTVTGNITLYAKWNATTATTTYTVTFDLNGGSGITPSAQTVESGSSITLPYGYDLTRDGFDFGGWNTNADGSGNHYNAYSSYSVTGNITLYAKWDQIVPFGIEFSGFSDDAIDLSRDRENDISKSRGGTLVVTVAGQFDSYAWYINGTEAPSSWVNGNYITLDADLEALSAGVHILTAVVTKGGTPYSKVLTFRVVWY